MNGGCASRFELRLIELIWFDILEQVNVKGLFNVARSFIPTRNPNSTLINISAGSCLLPEFLANLSAYNSSKFAGLKLLESIGAEIPDLHVVSLHPGVGKSERTGSFPF